MRPPRLRAGDPVRLVAPAGPVPEDLLEQAGPCCRLGGRAAVEPLVRAASAALPYLGGSDASPGRGVQRAWCDPDVAAVICVRGGYGVLRMLDLLDWQRWPRPRRRSSPAPAT